MNSQTAFRISAVLGFLAVALGAFGAHGLKATFEANGQAANWQTASHYHLIHAAVMLGLAAVQPWRRTAWWLMLVGVIIFSGSLYVLALTNLKWLGAITPIGGLSLLAGWLVLGKGRTE